MTNLTPEAETGGELRKKIELFNLAGPHACHCERSTDTGCTCAMKDEYLDEVMSLIAAHTRRAVLLGKLEEQYRIGTGSLITGALGIVYFNEDGSTYKSQDDRIKALEAELKEIKL